MFKKSVALLLVLCDIVFCVTSGEFTSEYPRRRHDASRRRLTDGRVLVPTTQDYDRTRRGIVLVDDDFNVSPEPGVNQGWSDGVFDKKETKATKMAEPEGSGKSSEVAELATQYSIKTSEVEELATQRYSIKTSPGKLEMASKESSKLTSEADIEGSGEEITTSTTEQPTETPSKQHIPNSCLNSTCDSKEIVVFPDHTEVVPEGTNISLTCIQVNSSELGTLQWYKYNESAEPLLQASERRLELTFDIPKSLVEHSGRYVCIRSSSESCCHRQMSVTVYEVPNYRYHLIIIGVVAAVSLFSCLLLTVCRNFRAKKYEVQMELQNMESECIYKM